MNVTQKLIVGENSPESVVVGRDCQINAQCGRISPRQRRQWI